MKQTNFGQNIEWMPNNLYQPRTEEDVLEILRRHRGQRIRCVGRRHSWSRVLEADEVMLDLRHLDDVEPVLDDSRPAVRVGAGCQIKHLLSKLEKETDWTLPSVGFITEQTIAGAISTGTHGSGRSSLSHYVRSIRVARYDPGTGDAVISEIESGDELRAARCSLGGMGVILCVTMERRPKYQVEEHFREYRELADVLHAEAEYPLQQFYLVPWRWSYFAQHRREVTTKTSAALWLYHWYRFLVIDCGMHWLILFAARLLSHSAVRFVFRWIAPACVIRSWRVTGPASSQLVMEHELFRHVEIELFVHRTKLLDSVKFLRQFLVALSAGKGALPEDLRTQLAESGIVEEVERLRGEFCHHYPICIRKIRPDDTLVSMATNAGCEPESEAAQGQAQEQQAWYSITLTNYHRGEPRARFMNVAALLARSMADQFEARPHWGKICPLSSDQLCSLYPAFSRFADQLQQVDPEGVFRNEWVDELLSSSNAARAA